MHALFLVLQPGGLFFGAESEDEDEEMQAVRLDGADQDLDYVHRDRSKEAREERKEAVRASACASAVSLHSSCLCPLEVVCAFSALR